MFHDFVQSFESLVIVSIRMNGVRWQEWYRGFHVCYFLLLQYSLSILSPIWKSNSTSVKVWKSSKKTRFRQRSTVLKTSTYAMHSHQNCTMSLWPPHVPICHLRMRDIYDSVHTVATIAKLPEKALKITLICDFNRVVLHQYCMYGFRDRESGLEKGWSWLCQCVGDLVVI